MNHPILITFDGLQGVGKTTQIDLLSESAVVPVKRIGRINRTINRLDKLIASIHRKNKRIPMAVYILKYLVSMNHRQTQMEPDTLNVMDWFWHWLMRYESDLSFFKDCTKLLGVMPLVSFWITLPPEERRSRLLKRNTPFFDKIAKQSQQVWDDEQIMCDSITTALSSELKSFYIIDGLKPKDVIEGEILMILKQEGLGRLFPSDDPLLRRVMTLGFGDDGY